MKNKEQELQELKAKAYDCIAHYETAIKVAEQYKESLNEINMQIVELQTYLQEKEQEVKETE
jgi:hypothetical protein